MEIFLCITFAVLGFIPLLMVMWKRRQIKQLKQNGILVTGVVEDIIASRGYKGAINYHAIIQYYAEGRGTIRGSYRYSHSGKRPLFARRQSVELYYDKNKPGKFTPKDGYTYTPALVGFALMAAAFLALSLAIINYITRQSM